MKNICIYISILSLCLATSSLKAQDFIGEKEDIDAILENIATFSKLVTNSEFEEIGKAYSDDAKIFVNNLEVIEGREAITDYWTLPDGIRIVYHKILPKEIKVIGDEAYDWGYYEGKTQTSENTNFWRGKYVIIWKKIEGEWKIYLDIWNRIEGG